MDPILYNKLLEELAETDEMPDEPGAFKRMGRQSIEEQEFEREFLEANDGVNPTKARVIKRLKPNPTMCEDCGRVCERGRTVETKMHYTLGKHWKSHCLECDLWLNPNTGIYDLARSQTAPVYRQWMKENKPKTS